MSIPAINEFRNRLRLELGWQDENVKSGWVLMGSVVMYLHGLREEVGDVDLFVTPTKWGELIDKGWDCETPRVDDPPIAATDLEGIDVRLNAFFDWDKRHGYSQFEGGIVKAGIARAEFFEGLWCQSLDQLATWKEYLAANNVHPKHGRDVALIRGYLDGNDTMVMQEVSEDKGAQ